MAPDSTAELPLTVLTFNLNNPSPERAERQLAWLTARPEQVLVLTETAPSRGCDLLAARLAESGYGVTFPRPEPGERGVMIASRLPSASVPPVKINYLPHRAVSISVVQHDGPLEILGLYIPSRDASAAKIARKRDFLTECMTTIPAGADAARVVIGDFNILEPDHIPRYKTFRPFEYAFYAWLSQAEYRDAFRLKHSTAAEYSWVGRTGDGYRYDHAFVSNAMADRVDVCAYVHETRSHPRLTDHSALTLRIAHPALARHC
ncbi:endonuclease/exonuclease/phosphatase family protein [Streptomyces sp. NPDC045456]|uniref:endonuclease/exonuclease/phosphatase family protein n=1 Tax=Streptomyces sp. NPDC045456 TaxID=3155254 RepID=UPI0033C8C7BF